MILIDPPYWPAHGTVFSHLVSDTSLTELHDFAAAAGLRKRAFDLDHYDVPERLYHRLIVAGAAPVSGKDLVRALTASGLRVKARHRGKSTVKALSYRWNTVMPGHPEVGAGLLERWNEPHRNYHSAVHLLAVLEALDLLTDVGAPREVTLAAWFHDAVYDGVAGSDEEKSAFLAQSQLFGLVSAVEAAEVARLVRLTATHSPSPTDFGGALLCDGDLSILGSSPADYARYVAGVRADYAHVSTPNFARGRAAVLHSLLAIDPLFHTNRGRELWAENAKVNITNELVQLD